MSSKSLFCCREVVGETSHWNSECCLCRVHTVCETLRGHAGTEESINGSYWLYGNYKVLAQIEFSLLLTAIQQHDVVNQLPPLSPH